MSLSPYIMKGCELLAHENLEGLTHKNEDIVRQFWMCAGAMEATVQLMELHHEICLPSAIKHVELAKVISHYMVHHHEKSNENYAVVMFSGLQDAWPCKKADK